MQTPVKVFLSYAHRDGAVARELGRALLDSGIDVDFDTGIPIGSDWGSYLRRVMGAADVVIILMTAAALGSPAVMSEVGAAIATGKIIIPILANSKGMPAGMPVQLRRWNFVRIGKRDLTAVAMEIRDRLQQHQPATAA